MPYRAIYLVWPINRHTMEEKAAALLMKMFQHSTAYRLMIQYMEREVALLLIKWIHMTGLFWSKWAVIETKFNKFSLC